MARTRNKFKFVLTFLFHLMGLTCIYIYKGRLSMYVNTLNLFKGDCKAYRLFHENFNSIIKNDLFKTVLLNNKMLLDIIYLFHNFSITG